MFRSRSHSEACCPYCLKKIGFGNVRFFCVTDDDRRHEVYMSFMDRFKKRLPVCRRNFCKNKGQTIHEAECRHCGALIPPQILFHDRYLNFCTIGVAGAGKSTYLTTMLHELRYSPLPLVLQSMDVSTTELAKANENHVYEDRQCLAGTKAGVAPGPQLWVILDNSKAKAKIPTYAMTIYDGAGEDCEHIGYTAVDAAMNRYISGAGMILIMFDPLILPNVRNEIASDILNASLSPERQMSTPANMVSMINSLANYIRQSRNIRPGSKINIHVAVVLTKLDALRNIIGGFDSHSTLLRESPHINGGGFAESDSKMVDLEIRDWLTRQGEIAFLNAVDANFKTVRVFGVSSFGNPPDVNKCLAKVRPHRVLDPIMWMLAGEKIIPTI